MFFTKVGRFVAALLFTVAVAQLLLGFAILFGTESMEDNRYFSQRIAGEATSGAIIDKASLYIFIAIALGIATEISRNVHLLRADRERVEDTIEEDV
ncbi:hypothetical protein [Gymnodinialimonas sp. 57CJ19]|uniref:hypothetical protein n=1 Tax=Gymnodinialimonas sp. 57CJ19 TaxID=3138498 RepID=UPI0031344C5D